MALYPSDRAQHHVAVTDVWSGFAALTSEECRRLLRANRIGRLAVTVGALPCVLPVQYAHGVKWEPLRFARRLFSGFEESLDLIGDGRMVMVKLPGHGALGLFLRLDDGRRFFFRGDAAGAARNPPPLPVDVLQMQDSRLQARLGFYPRWIE